MREKFKEFYKATPQEISAFWESAHFSFDANVLLNLYRYTESTRNEILSTLKYLADNHRLWISYQAAFEYQKNRLIVISALKNAYDGLMETLNKKSKELYADLNNYKRHPYLRIEDLKVKLSEAIELVNSELEKLKGEHPDFLDEDPIFDELTGILENCIGDAFEQQALQPIFSEGKERYEKKVPPGYMDKEKEKNGEQSLYGDLIIWKELIYKSKELGKDFVFVTDDLKEDWWYIFNGKTIYPRPELIREFRKETNKEIIIYKPEQFLQYFNSNIKNQVKEETLQEVLETREIDEEFSQYLIHSKKDFIDRFTKQIAHMDLKNNYSIISGDSINRWVNTQNNYNPEMLQKIKEQIYDIDLTDKFYSSDALSKIKIFEDLKINLDHDLDTFEKIKNRLNLSLASYKNPAPNLKPSNSDDDSDLRPLSK